MTLFVKKDFIEEVCADIGAEVRKDELLKHYTSMGVGGPVEYIILPSTIEAIQKIIQELHKHDIPFRVLGAGTNIIADDAGINEVLLSTELLKKSVTIEEKKVTAIAGTMLSRLIRQLAESGLGGLEFAEGIPGSLGGAVLMNAGSFDHSLSEFVKEVTVIDETGKKHMRKMKPEDFGYRTSPFSPGAFISEIALEFYPKERSHILSRIEEARKMRSDTQPTRVKSSGCIFKNPKGDRAGRILDSLGFKKKKKGNAMISPVHANYIINLGGARSDDIYWLIDRIKEEVLKKLGIILEEEVILWKKSP
jgi:UDP-N-acetylmuramate dehydrogenase